MVESQNRVAGEVSAALAPLSRRRFLKTGLLVTAGATAALAGGFALLRRSPRDQMAMPAGLKHLEPAHYHLFARLAEVLLPTAGTALFPVGKVPVVANVDAILGALEPAVRQQLAVGLSLFDNAAVLGNWKRFVDLTDDDARTYVSEWVNSDVMPKRAIGFVVSKLTHTGYWMDERTWPAIDFDGAVTKKWGIPSRGNQPLPA
jgi:hypothetical protein